jgi:hypothetical protein
VRALTSRLGPGLCLLAMALGAGCDNSRSPTEAGGLAQARREARQTPRRAEIIDALFLGTGPLIPRNGQTLCPTQAVWSGYPRGTTVRVRVAGDLAGTIRDSLEQAVGSLAVTTGGALTAVVEVASEADPQPGVNEVTVLQSPAPRAAGCPSDAGCVEYRFAGRGLLMGARVIGPPGQPVADYVRDTVGHGVLGLCRLDARLIGGPENSLMSGGVGVEPGAGASSLTGLDLDAIGAVYASPLSPGATRSAFLAARLVDLQAGQLPRGR